MANAELIYQTLSKLDSTTKLRSLFSSQLGYEYIGSTLSTRDWTPQVADSVLSGSIIASQNSFQILYVQLAALRRTVERPIVAQLLREYPYSLIVFSDNDQTNWHFLNVKYDGDVKRRKIFRRISVGPYERLRTASERIALLDVEAMPRTLFGLDALAIQAAHDQAFDVEAVTKEFFGNYTKVFDALQTELRRKSRDARWAHDYAQQFLNRVMFLYFIQRKRWLGDDPEFIGNLWKAYRKAERPKDTFFEEWLSILFFEAFNNQFQAGRADYAYFPKPYRDAFASAPYLNGGLFERNDLDRKYDIRIDDKFFQMLFDRFEGTSPGFFERYNFTIAEDSPFDQEVAVDPEMIGKVYESLVNVTSEGIEEEDKRGEAGIVYTPRVEIDLMCRLSLVDYMANHLGDQHKARLYEAVSSVLIWSGTTSANKLV